MKLLKDDQLKDLYTGTKPVISGIPAPKNWIDAGSPVQPSSIDLHIGKISVPAERTSQKPIEINEGDYSLPPGQTAIVTTLEQLHMPSNIAAIGFPPSHISIKGLLVTNPGHVDPGYDGPMHLTLINMARDPFELTIRDPIVTMLFFELESDVTANWLTRNGRPGSSLSPNLVNKLSRDFVNVENRARKVAGDAVRRATIIATLLVAGVTLGAQFVPYYLGGIEEAKRNDAVLAQQVKALEEKVKSLEDKQQPKTDLMTTTRVKPSAGPSRSGAK
jgi:deoxycytidine triphosphate deaminase